MARKITPSGTGGYPDLNIYEDSQDSTWLENLTANIAQNYQNIIEKKDTSGASAMELLLKQVGNATSLAEINQIKSMYNTMIDDNYVSNNPYYNVLKEQFSETNSDSAINTISTNIKDVNVLASSFYKKLTSSDNEFGMPILDMGGDELYDYYDGLNNKEGWATQLAKERFELSTFNNLLNSTFGNKNPNYQIKYTDDSGEERSVRLGDVRRLVNKYDDQQEAIIFGALEDKIFSREEAMTIAAITGEDGRGVQSFFNIRNKKIADYQEMLTRSGKTQNNIINKLSSLIGKKDKTSNYQAILNQYISTGNDGGAGLKDGVMAMSQSPIVEKNYPAELGSLEGLNAEEKFTKILEDMTTDDGLTKDKLQFLLADVARENADDRTMGIAGLKAWGGSSKVEYKPDPRDVKSALFDGKGNLLPGQTDKFGYATGMSIGETKEEISDEEKPVDIDVGGNIPQVAEIMKKYEAVPEDSTLSSLNNLYAMKYGNRTSKYGAVDSGIPAPDGGTWAQWPDKESMEAGSQKVIEEMFLDDAKGDVETFVGNYIGKDDINDPEVQSRVKEIQNISPLEQEEITVTAEKMEQIPEDIQINTESQNPIQSFINEYKDEAVVGTGIGIGLSQSQKIREVTKNSINYLKRVIKLPEEQIAKLFSDSDVAKITKKLNSQLDKIDNFKKSLPIGVDAKDLKAGTPTFKKYKSLLKQYEQIIKNNLNKLKVRYPDVDEKTLTKMLRNSNKWNLFKVKSSVATGLREIVRTPKDILRLTGKGGMKIGPLEGAMLGWYAGQKIDLGWEGKTAAAGIGAYTTKKILQGIANKGGMKAAMMNPELQSKIGKYLLQKAPGLAAKMGLKATAGAAAQVFPGIGTLVGTGMLAWTLNDIKNLIKDVPEIKQYLVEYLEGDYDEPLKEQ